MPHFNHVEIERVTGAPPISPIPPPQHFSPLFFYILNSHEQPSPSILQLKKGRELFFGCYAQIKTNLSSVFRPAHLKKGIKKISGSACRVCWFLGRYFVIDWWWAGCWVDTQVCLFALRVYVCVCVCVCVMLIKTKFLLTRGNGFSLEKVSFTKTMFSLIY